MLAIAVIKYGDLGHTVRVGLARRRLVQNCGIGLTFMLIIVCIAGRIICLDDSSYGKPNNILDDSSVTKSSVGIDCHHNQYGFKKNELVLFHLMHVLKVSRLTQTSVVFTGASLKPSTRSA